jgi:hypothetical protein
MLAQGSSSDSLLPLPKNAHALLAPTTIEFSFTPRDPAEKSWTITVDRDRHATFLESGAAGPQAISVSSATLSVLEAGGDAVAANRCESRQKNIAKTGAKKIAYTLGPSLASCEFNFSDDDALNRTANTFLAIAETLKIGAELARLHRFDRLGLDAEMEVLEKELNSGFAVEVENIAPVLQSIAQDERVMERVRRKAAHLLEPPQHNR